MWHFLVFICYCLTLFMGSSALPSRRSSLPFNGSDAHTELVDRNNRQDVLRKFNLTEAQMSSINARMNAGSKDSEEDGRTTQYFHNLREFR